MIPAVADVVNVELELKLQLLLISISAYRLFPTAAKMLVPFDELFTPAIAVIFWELTEQKIGESVVSTFVTMLTVPTLVPTTRPGVEEEPLRNVPNALTPPLAPLADEVHCDRPVLVLVMAKQSARLLLFAVMSDPA